MARDAVRLPEYASQITVSNKDTLAATYITNLIMTASNLIISVAAQSYTIVTQAQYYTNFTGNILL